MRLYEFGTRPHEAKTPEEKRNIELYEAFVLQALATNNLVAATRPIK